MNKKVYLLFTYLCVSLCACRKTDQGSESVSQETEQNISQDNEQAFIDKYNDVFVAAGAKRAALIYSHGSLSKKYYWIMEFDPCCCLIDWFSLNISYEGESYSEEDKFMYREREISMEEFEEIRDSIQSPGTSN